MNKTELISAVAEQSGLTKKDAEKAVTAVIDTIIDSVAKDEKVQIAGFGTFEQRQERQEQAATQEQVIQLKSQHLRFRLSRQARYLRIL